MPERNWLTTGISHRSRSIVIIQRSREGDDSYPH
jgi:hypothetical protein